MKEKFVNYMLNYLAKSKNYSKSQMAKFKYSLEALYSLVTKMSVVIILAIILKTITPVLWFLLFYTLIRMCGFGLHASKNIYCWIITLSVYVIIPYLITNVRFNNIFYIIFSFSALCIVLFCPADTPKRPLTHKKKRLLNKYLVVLTCLIYLLLVLFIENGIIKYSILYSLIVQALISNPLVYKLFGVTFNNYKYHKKPNNE